MSIPNDQEFDSFWSKVHKAMIQRFLMINHMITADKLLNSNIESGCINSWNGEDYWDIRLYANLNDFDYLSSKKEEIKEVIESILHGRSDHCSSFEICYELPDLEQGWKDNLRAIMHGEKVSNQGVLVSAAPYEYNGLYFRSKTEIKIAEALDRAGVLYFPLPVACFKGRRREPDFLVRTITGKWGILEVQGEPYHPATRADQDHERSRAFMSFGIPVQFYGSEKCFKQPDKVVAEFLHVVSAM